MSATLLLIDGHGLAFRAFYAMPDLQNTSGQPTHAILGFANMVLKAINQTKPDYVALAFDRGRPTVRMESFEAYKAQRQHAPEGLSAQMPWIEK